MTKGELISLKEYFDIRLKDIMRLLDERFKTQKSALELAEHALTLRLESMNEFREQINKERGTYATKETLTLLLDTFDSRLKKLEMANAFASGKMWMVMAGFVAIPTIIALIALLSH